MSKIIIYEKPTCSTCRKVMGTMKEKGVDFEPIDYYKTPLTKAKLKELLRAMRMSAKDILRKNEEIYKKLGLARKQLSDDELIELMVRYPDLMQRPIVVKGKKVILARPPEKIQELL